MSSSLLTTCLVPEWPAPPQVRALCTARSGGRSQPPWDSLNLGTHVGDDILAVQRNRETLAQTIASRPVFMNQVHGQRVLELTDDTVDGLDADAATTSRAGLACTVMVADCLPVLLCDTQGRRVAAAHAGWRGLAGQGGTDVLQQTLRSFMPEARMEPAQAAIEIIAWLGPCIGPDAFEVGDEVRTAFVNQHPDAAKLFVSTGVGGKWLADLPGLARQRLRALGVKRIYGNDGSQEWCTVGNPSRFFSHRRDRVSGRQAACIWLV